MTAPTLTAAQERALDWLPGDGRWLRVPIGDSGLHVALSDLCSASKVLTAMDFNGLYARLTPAGLALKAGRGGLHSTEASREVVKDIRNESAATHPTPSINETH